MDSLSHFSDDALLVQIESLLTSQRGLTARLVSYLAEVEDRRLHLKAAYSSMFEFCTERLGMSEGEAFRRINAARLSRRFPVIVERIERGAIHLSALVLLRTHLTEENHVELLDAASGKSKRDLEALLAARFPLPDVPSTIRKVPARRAPANIRPDPPSLATGKEPRETERAEAKLPLFTANAPPPSRLQPLSARHYKVQFTADEPLKQKLERARDLLRHASPGGDLGVVVDRALDLLLAELEKKKLGKTGTRELGGRKNGARPTKTAARPETVTRAARRDVFERDGERCTFLGADGRRCPARAFLELDHITPRSLGGAGDSHNVRVLCRAHNRLRAEQAFGREHVEARIRVRRRSEREAVEAANGQRLPKT